MDQRAILAVMVLLPALWLGAPASPGPAADDVPRMSVQQLKNLLDNPSVRVIDVRTGPDWDQSRHRIRGAMRRPADKVDAWAKTYRKDLTLVLYCR